MLIRSLQRDLQALVAGRRRVDARVDEVPSLHPAYPSAAAQSVLVCTHLASGLAVSVSCCDFISSRSVNVFGVPSVATAQEVTDVRSDDEDDGDDKDD